jgi:putative ABC transport system permease protein
MFFLPFKEMTFFKVRYLLISFIIFFVAVLVFIINGLANGLAMNNASSIINMPASSFYLQKNVEGRIDRSHLQINLEKVQSKSGVEPIGIQMGALSQVGSDNQLDVTFMAMKEGGFLKPDVMEGEDFITGVKNEVLLDRSLKSEKVKIGSIVKDARTGIKLKVSGFIHDQTFSHTPVAIVSFDTWGSLSGGPQNSKYNAVVSKNNDTVSRKEISKLVEGGVWVNKETVIKGVPGYTAEQNSLMMMLSFLIIIAVFVLAAFFYIMTIQKTSQFGILKAIGAKSSYLIKSTIVQVILLTLFSIATAVGFTRIFKAVLPIDIPFIFDLMQIIKFSGILFLVSIFGSLLSVFNITRADPVQAMGRLE